MHWRGWFGHARLWLAAVGLVGAVARGQQVALPAGATVIEKTRIPASIHRDRALVLWMLAPERHDRGALSEDNPYTCPDYTLGSFYSGPTRISLVEAHSGQVVNTIALRSSIEEEDVFSVPYRILAGHSYLVPGIVKGREGRPALLKLRDLNGDGLALETAFHEALACMGLQTTLLGYSPRQDRVIQYEVELDVTLKTRGECSGHAGAGRDEAGVVGLGGLPVCHQGQAAGVLGV